MILKFKCDNCLTEKLTDAIEYDGLLGYESVICKRCGCYSDHDGHHQADDWSRELANTNTLSFSGVKATLITNEHGYADYNISGHPQGIYRVKICPDINVGEIFSAYSGESTKTGIKWLGSIEQSLHNTCLNTKLT